MRPNETILVATDFSRAAEHACDLAAELAERFGGSLVLLHVVEPTATPMPGSVEEARREALQAELERYASRLRPWLRDVRTALREGRPAEAIVDAVDELGAGLVVMGTHGRRGFLAAMLGSVAEKVVRSCERPVLTVPGATLEHRADAGRQLAGALTPFRGESPAVVALSRGALAVAAPIARALGAPLDVWLVAPMTSDGNVVGAVGEAGAPVFGPGLTLSPEARATAVARAGETLRAELEHLGGTRAPGELRGRTVIAVADAATTAEPFIAAALALRALGARRVVAVAAVLAREAIAATRASVDDVVALQLTVGSGAVETWVRDVSVPGDQAARALLEPAASPA